MSRDYQQAYKDALPLLLPPGEKGYVRWGDMDGYSLARAQWLHDHVSKAAGYRALKEINSYRSARDWDAHCKGIPEGDPRRYPPLELGR